MQSILKNLRGLIKGHSTTIRQTDSRFWDDKIGKKSRTAYLDFRGMKREKRCLCGKRVKGRDALHQY